MAFLASVECLQCSAKSLHSGRAVFPRSSLHDATSEISVQLLILILFEDGLPETHPNKFAAQELTKNEKEILMQVFWFLLHGCFLSSTSPKSLLHLQPQVLMSSLLLLESRSLLA